MLVGVHGVLRRGRSRYRAAIAIALVAIAIALGCQDGRHEAVRVAIEAAGGGLVDRVEVSPPNFLDDPKVRVFLIETAQPEEALRFACDVVSPAVRATGDPNLWWQVYNTDGTRSFAVGGEDCP